MTAAVASGHDYSMEVPSGMKPDVRSDQDFQEIVLSCNKDGMDLLRAGQYKQAFEQLKYAETVLLSKQGEDEQTSLMAVMCNNLGCYYKKVGKLHAALSYLRKALKIEVSLRTDDVTVAGTHLNICAILSKLEKHDKAVQHAVCALELINNRVASAADAVTQDEYSVLAIAYHNVAVERDYMHQWDQAAAAYQQGHHVAKKCLGDQHPLTQTLLKNCDAAQQKAQKYGKERPSMPSAYPTTGGASSSSIGPVLPGISGGNSARGKGDPMPIMPRNSVHQEASEWVQGRELARRPPQGGAPAVQPQPPAPSQYQRVGPSSLPSPRSMNLQVGTYQPPPPPPLLESQQVLTTGADSRSLWTQPSYLDAVAPDVSAATVSLTSAAVPVARPPSPPPLVVMGRERRHRSREAREDKPEVTPDTVAEHGQVRQRAREGGARAEVPTGRRPPRAPSKPEPSVPPPSAPRPSARAHRAARSTANAGGTGPGREVIAGGTAGPKPLHSQLLRRSAAEKIQRMWREKHRRRMQMRDRTKQEHACATMLQARWRAFHVRRTKLNKACTIIQKWVRGFRVRLVIRRHKAAVELQRHLRGLSVRRKIVGSTRAAIAIQRRVRGVQARQAARVKSERTLAATMILQRGLRMWKAKKEAGARLAEKDVEKARVAAATKIQSVFQGNKGRSKAAKSKVEWLRMVREQRAATRLQAAVRRHQAMKTAEAMRSKHIEGINKAATTIRKHWLRHVHRHAFLELREGFLQHEGSVVTVQRYARGYLVRLRMWRDAIRTEEELWAAMEIQRCWRGYLGRLRWELEYEAIWSREEAARRLQRYIRGWLGRTRVHRLRKRMARAEFEKARRRFKATQKIQALVRGHHARKRIMTVRERKVEAVVAIQRIQRGHQVRCRLWNQVMFKRTVLIQAVARGFLVRNRRFRLLAQVTHIQCHYRHWLKRVPEEERRRRVSEWRRRRKEAREVAQAQSRRLRG